MNGKTFDLIKSKLEREFDFKETMQVLTHNLPIYMSWGVSSRGQMDSKALILKVNGHHHKGYVVITLAWNDTYSVYLVSTHGNLVKEFQEVYFDCLTELIDNHIERIPEYKD